MDFKKTVQKETGISYRNMQSGHAPAPFNIGSIEQCETFERNFDNYHKRLETERILFNSSLTQVVRKRDDSLRSENEAKRLRREKQEHRRFLCMEWLKTVAFNIPTIAFFILSLILVGRPELILTHIHFGWIIAIYVVALIASVLTAGVIIRKYNFGPAYALVKQRCAIMIAGAMIFSALMCIGFSSLSKHIYYFSDARLVNKFIDNTPLRTKIKIDITRKIKSSDGLEVENGYIVGLGTCIDKFIFIDLPISEHAFEESKELNRLPNCKIILMDGCTQIQDLAFSKCSSITGCYFLQDQVPDIQYDVFCCTWDYYKNGFNIIVPDNLLESYKSVEEISWQNALVKGNRIKTYTNYITLERNYT